MKPRNRKAHVDPNAQWKVPGARASIRLGANATPTDEDWDDKTEPCGPPSEEKVPYRGEWGDVT